MLMAVWQHRNRNVYSESGCPFSNYDTERNNGPNHTHTHGHVTSYHLAMHIPASHSEHSTSNNITLLSWQHEKVFDFILNVYLL